VPAICGWEHGGRHRSVCGKDARSLSVAFVMFPERCMKEYEPGCGGVRHWRGRVPVAANTGGARRRCRQTLRSDHPCQITGNAR
jgi:hypothetical protein